MQLLKVALNGTPSSEQNAKWEWNKIRVTTRLLTADKADWQQLSSSVLKIIILSTKLYKLFMKENCHMLKTRRNVLH